MQEAANAFIAENLGRASRISLRHTVSALINPEEMRKAGADAVPAFPSAGACPGYLDRVATLEMCWFSQRNRLMVIAAFVAEAYDAMGLANKKQLTRTQPPLSAATVTPRDLASSKIRLQAPPNGAKPPAFGRLLPIRLE